MNLPKSLTFLSNFCKGFKIHHFSSEIIFGQLLLTFGELFLVTLIVTYLLASLGQDYKLSSSNLILQ